MRPLIIGSIVALSVTSALPAMAVERARRSSDPDLVPGHFVATSSHSSALPGGQRMLGHLVIEVEPEGDPAAQAERLSRELGIDLEPMVMYQLMERPWTEPRFDEQWNLENRGQTGGTPGADIDAPAAWRWTTGEGSTIAVVDSGVDAAHPELMDRLWTNSDEIPGNGLDDDANGFVDDLHGWDFRADDADPTDTVGHGTAVTSVAVAAANDIGMAGVAPAARAMPIRSCDGLGCPASAVAAGIVYAVDNGADVVNLSLGAPGSEPLVTAAVEYAADHDVLVVSAAGNSGVRLDAATQWTPASIDTANLVAVAATTDLDRLTTSSNYGPDVVDLAAPGWEILVAAPGDAYDIRSGTSFAAPHVAGVAALMKSLDVGLLSEESAQLLRLHSHRLESLTGLVEAEGRLDARVAVQAARFRDIPGSEFADDAMWAATEGLSDGCGRTRFCPEAVVTRGQMAALLRRALQLPGAADDAFVDDEGSIFEADIDAIAAAGLTTGCTVVRFCPDDAVSRGQMAAFLVRALALPPGGRNAFDDDDGSVFEADIDALAEAGITFGCDPPARSSFCPESSITRGQMVALLRRALA